MKKIICFAGFADSELPTLRAATATSNALWECRFVADAPAALAALAEAPFDALVANMAMPGKNGAELMREVRQSSPHTQGFIVGQVTDQAHIVDCIGGPHQFIRRPFLPAKLLGCLKRGLSLEAWLATDELRHLAPQLRRLPSLPSTYFNLLKEIESEHVTTQSIGAIIARDPVVTARLLQMVNSAAFSLAQKVTDPVDAVTLLGIETIKSLVLCLQVFSQSDEARAAGLSLELLWEHSLVVAKFARQITLKQTADARLAGDAFTAGLLHDVGRIVLASNLPKEYAAIIASARANSRPLHEEETAQLRVNHAQVGAYLLGLWGLPVEFLEAAAGHHAPGKTVFAAEFSLLAAVHAANVFAHAAGGQTDGLCLPQLDLPYFQTTHLEDQLPVWLEACTGEKPSPPPKKAESPAPPPASAEATPPPAAPSAPRFAYGWIVVVLLLLGVGGLAAWHFSNRSAPPTAVAALAETNLVAQPPPAPVEPVKPAPAPAPVPVPAPAPATTVNSKPPPGAFDKVRLQGIIYRSAHPLALINGQTVGVGDEVDGFKVAAIDQNSVTLLLNGERRIFRPK